MKQPMRTLALALLLGGVAAAQGAAPAPKFEQLAKSSTSWDGSPLPAYPKGTPQITILKVTYAPGSETDMHDHPVINAGVLLSGQLTVFTEDKTLHLKAGDSLVEIMNQKHYGKNEGDTSAVLLMFYAGTTDLPITVPK